MDQTEDIMEWKVDQTEDIMEWEVGLLARERKVNILPCKREC